MFLSCNEPTATCDWCKRCDKCAFIFLLLSAHLPPALVVHTVFGGENMLGNPLCRGLFMRLIGKSSDKGKPLDCVGTVQEASAAVHLSAVQYSRCTMNMNWRRECKSDKKGCVASSIRGAAQDSLGVNCDVDRSGAIQSNTDGDNHSAIAGNEGEGPLPVLLNELCQLLCIECDTNSGEPVVNEENAILKLWGICD